MGDSRTKNTLRIIRSGILGRLISTILPFINRTIIIHILGAGFAGLSGLFTSILSVLNIAELGFHSAVVYSMYEPVAKQDDRRVCELLTLYRRIYRFVGATIFLAGVCIMPFLPRLIRAGVPDSINLYVLYLMYLSNSVLSYLLFSYRESVLMATQRQDISQIIRAVVKVLQCALQMLVLIWTKNFYAYLLVEIFCTGVTNIVLAVETGKKFPQYRCVKEKVPMPESIKKQVSGLLVGRICDKARNSFDSIILSAFFGLTTVAIYDNYYQIYSALYSIMLVVCNSMAASIGNSIIKETVEKNYQDLLKFSFIQAWISGWISICMLCLYQPVMRVWMGESLMFPTRDMVMMCIYFYAINMNNIRNQFVSGTGMWWKLKYSYAVEAVANILLNVVLGKLFGITGVILATILTIFFMNFLWRNVMLFQNYFRGKSLKTFLMDHLGWATAIAVAAALTYFLCGRIKAGAVLQIIINGVICTVVPNLILLLLFCKTKQFREAKAFGNRILKHIVKRV